MIKSITLKNWKSFGEATLYVDPLTVLIGTNASGKSNFLDAIRFYAAVAEGKDIESLFEESDADDRVVRGDRKAQFNNPELDIIIEVVVLGLKENDPVCTHKIVVGFVEQTNKIFIRNEVFFEEIDNIQRKILEFKNSSRSVYGMSLDKVLSKNPSLADRKSVLQAPAVIRTQIKHLQFIDPVPQNMKSYSPTSRHLKSDGSNVAGYLQGQENKEIVEERLSQALRNLPENEIVRIWTEKVGRLGSDANLYCEEKWKGSEEPFLTDLKGLSDGSLRLIAILTALLTAEKGSTVVIEEVDNGLHPSRAGLLVNLLKKIGTERQIDIICTTHNPALLDAFGLSMLPFIALVYRDPENGTSQIKNLDEIENYERIITKGTLGDLITKGRFESVLKAS